MAKSRRTTKKRLSPINERKRSRKVRSRKVRSRKVSKKRSRKINKKRSKKVRRRNSFAMDTPPNSSTSVPEPVEDICSLIPSHINNQIVFTDILNVEEIYSDDILKVFKDPTNGKSFSVIKKHIAGGANGYVYDGTFNGMNIVIKALGSSKEKFERMIEEMVIQTHLACGHNSELEKIDSLLIPKIYFIAKTKNNYLIGTEKLDGDLHYFIKSEINTDKKSEIVKDLIFKISRTLLLLQKKCNFIHGDLHIKNIMYKGDINDPDNLKWYIIDFGMSAINIKNNETDSDNIIVLSKYLKNYNGDSSYYESYDLVILFLSLATKIEIFNNDFQDWLAIHLVSPSTYISGEKDVLFHNAYDKTNISDPYLNPEFILSKTEPPYAGLIKSHGAYFENQDLSEILNNYFIIDAFID